MKVDKWYHLHGRTDYIVLEEVENPKPKKGKWRYMLRDSENDEYRCSVCYNPSGYNYDYCPHCGAYMVKGNSNDEL